MLPERVLVEWRQELLRSSPSVLERGPNVGARLHPLTLHDALEIGYR